MSRHLFDGAGRISAGELEEVAVALWQPPRIDARGHLVQVQPRQEPSRGDARGDGQQPDSGVSPGAGPDDGERQRIVEQCRAEGFEQGRAEGLEQGRAEGLEKGHAEGLQQAREEARRQLQPELAAINRLATSLTHALNEQDYQLEQALLHLVQEVARQVIQRELLTDNSTVLSIVRQALKTLPPASGNVRILIHPDDLPVLQQAIEEGGENWRAVPRHDVERGGCRIETDQSVLDFTTGQRFRSVIEQLIQKHLVDPAAEEEPEEAPEPLVPKPSESGESVSS